MISDLWLYRLSQARDKNFCQGKSKLELPRQLVRCRGHLLGPWPLLDNLTAAVPQDLGIVTVLLETTVLHECLFQAASGLNLVCACGPSEPAHPRGITPSQFNSYSFQGLSCSAQPYRTQVHT